MTAAAQDHWPLDRLVVVGVNHRSASAETRDALFLDEARLPAALEALKATDPGAAVVLSTCNRTDIIAFSRGEAPLADRLREVLAGWAGCDAAALAAEVYDLDGAEALRHVFAVAAGLDSLVIGEPEVFGQLKDAHRAARRAGLVGRELEGVLQAAYSVAKRVRSDTAIAEGPVSLAAAALSVARSLHGDLSGCTLVVVGAGDMGALIAGHFKTRGIGRLMVVDRLAARARAVSRRLDCVWAGPDGMAAALDHADIVVAAGGGRRVALDRPMLEAALKARRYRPILALDAGIPGTIDADVDAVDEIFLYRLEDLERIAQAGRQERARAAEAAWALVSAAVAEFVRDRAARAAVPAIAELRRYFEAQRQLALAESGGDADKATRLLVNRLLHGPSRGLRDLAAVTEGAGTLEWVKAHRLLERLFPLQEGAADNEESDD